MTGIVLQVRLDSSRLPGKALLEINGLKLIEHSMRSLKKIIADKYIVATTEDSISELGPYCQKWGFELYIGSKENVLERYIGAIDKYKLTQVIRATGDNPLVSHEVGNLLVKIHMELNNDYSVLTDSPIGTGVEIFKASALHLAYTKTVNPYDLEHVTPYIYNNKDKFKVFIQEVPQKYLLKNTRVTVDTKEDFNRIEKLFSQLYYGDIIPIESVITWLKKEI